MRRSGSVEAIATDAERGAWGGDRCSQASVYLATQYAVRAMSTRHVAPAWTLRCLWIFSGSMRCSRLTSPISNTESSPTSSPSSLSNSRLIVAGDGETGSDWWVLCGYLDFEASVSGADAECCGGSRIIDSMGTSGICGSSLPIEGWRWEAVMIPRCGSRRRKSSKLINSWRSFRNKELLRGRRVVTK